MSVTLDLRDGMSPFNEYLKSLPSRFVHVPSFLISRYQIVHYRVF